MSENSQRCFSEDEQSAVRAQLDRMGRSAVFGQSQRRRRFLEFLVTEALAGRSDRLKGYTIATEIFERSADFDPAVDPVVRIEAGRLRDKLREYYDGEGRNDPVTISLPKGSYKPDIRIADAGHPQEADVSSATPGLHPGRATSWRPKRVIWPVLAAAALFVVIGVGTWKWLSPPAPLIERPTIAVLPFANIGNDPNWTRFADGLTDDVITDLSHARGLFVVARNSTEVYRGKGKDVRDIGRELGTKYVLEGSIQESNGQIRVAAQLIDAATGGHAWSSRYDRPATDLFAVQRDVSEKIVATLTGYGGALTQAEQSGVRRKLPESLTAYENYLLGLEAKHAEADGVVSEAALARAEELFLKALTVDPQLARAYIALCYIYEYRIDFGIQSAEQNLAKHMDAARKAARLDPNDGEAQLVLGHAYAYRDMTDQALDQFAKAEGLAPNNADVLILIAWYLPRIDQPDRAAALADRALQLNPNYPGWYNQGLRYAYFFARRFDKSIKHSKLVAKPQPLDLAYLAAAAAMSDRMAEAETAAQALTRADPAWTVEKYLSDNGGYPERMANLFVEAATKAGVTACLPRDRLPSQPSLHRIKACDTLRQASVLP